MCVKIVVYVKNFRFNSYMSHIWHELSNYTIIYQEYVLIYFFYQKQYQGRPLHSLSKSRFKRLNVKYLTWKKCLCNWISKTSKGTVKIAIWIVACQKFEMKVSFKLNVSIRLDVSNIKLIRKVFLKCYMDKL